MKGLTISRIVMIVAASSLVACLQEETSTTDATVEPAQQTTVEPSTLTQQSMTLEEGQRPNILLIVADDLGFTDIGAFGGEIPTPNLDALAYEGIRLTNFHTGRACQQTRAMLMSSRGTSSVIERFPERSDGQRDSRLTLAVATLPELMQEAGYTTYISGKWDLGLWEEYTPADRGFDRSFGLLEASTSHFAEYFWGDEVYYHEDGVSLDLEDLPEDFYSTQAYTDKMLEYLQGHEGDQPWFAYLPYTAPHAPLQVPEEWLDRHAGEYDEGYDVLREKRFAAALEKGVLPEGSTLENFESLVEPWDDLSAQEQERYARAQEIYASMVEYMDQSIGRIIDWLKESGQIENTILMFMSDNGASGGENGVNTGRVPDLGGPPMIEDVDNTLENFGLAMSYIDHGIGFGEAATAPLKYLKGLLAEGGIRAAAFIRYPAQLPTPDVDPEFITVLDILPTFLDIAESEHPGASEFYGREIMPALGRSFWPYLTGEADWVHTETDTMGWVAGDIGAIVRGRYKAINQGTPGQVEKGATEPWRLYDIEADPGETTDLSNENPDITAELSQEWGESWKN